MIKLRPEIKDIKYWIHLILIVLIVYFLVNNFVQPMEITLSNVLLGTLFLGLADVVVHSLLQLD